MRRFRHIICFASVSLCAAAALAAEKPPVVTVGQAPGLLAISSQPGVAWRVLAQGDALPEDCRLRAAGVGPCLIELPGATLSVRPPARLRLASRRRLAVLELGGAFLQVGRASPWTMTVGGLKVVLQKGSAAELAVEPGKPVSVHVTRGSAAITRGDDRPIRAAAGTTISFDPATDTVESALLKPEQQQRIEAWTTLKGPSQGLGQLLIKDVQSGAPTRLNVARYHAHVVLQPPVALVQIDQSFYNPYSRQEEGTFVFNLPRGASVSRFAMYVTPERLIEGELIERRRASEIYESIVRQRRDPAILEQIGDNLFRMRVFPILAKDTKRILLDYTLPLEDEGGTCRFRLPLFSDLEPIWDFRLTGTIQGPTRLQSVASRSHPSIALRSQEGEQIAFELIKKDYRPESDFLLTFTQRPGEKASLRSYVAEPLPGVEDDGGQWTDGASDDPFAESPLIAYFMASLQPGSDESTRQEPKAADVLILVDTSSGMRNCVALGRSVQTVVRNLRPGDRFRLVCVDVGARPLHDRWVEPNTKAADEALACFGEEFCLGSTDLDLSFREALKAFDARDPNRRRLAVYIGDGEDTLARFGARELPGQLAGHLKKAKAMLFGVIVRSSPQAAPQRPSGRAIDGKTLLRSLAQATGGLVFDLVGNPNGERDLFRWLLAGSPSPEKILKVEAEGAARQDLYYPTAWLPGQNLNVLGRTRATDRLRLNLTTTRGGRPATIRREFTVDSKQDDVFVGRLWAQRKLEQLRRQRSADSDVSDQRRQRILRLSQEWSLLSPYTAFLVLETEQDYARWNIDRRQRRRYWKPPGALPRAPLPADWVARVTPDTNGPADRQRFTRAVRSARKALAEGNHALAFRLLQRVGKLRMAAESREYVELSRRALAGVRGESPPGQVGSHHSLLDPAARAARPRFDASVAPLVCASMPISSEFLRRHPYARQLLREVDSSMPWMTIQETAEFLAKRTGANVVIDHKALDDVGISVDQPLPGPGWGKISLRNYAWFVLGQLDLVLVEEPNRLLITTPEEAETKLTTEVYSVADLLLTDRVADWGVLTDPYMDHESVAKRRIRAKLKRPVSVQFVEKPLADVMQHFAKKLNDTVLIDLKGLSDVGFDPNSLPVTASYHDVPAEQALHWILDPFDLDHVIDHGALVILTPEEKENRLETRLHSGRGVVYEYSVPALQQAFTPWGGGGGFGISGMGGMRMGGMGFGGLGAGMGGMAMGFGAMGSPTGGRRPFVISAIPVGGPGESSQDVGFSEGGDANLLPDASQPDATEPTPESEDAIEPFDTNLSLPVSQTQRVRERFEYDIDSVAEQVTATIAPPSWDTVGGSASLAFFEPTLDFVVSATGEMHEQIELLFSRLRELPAVAGPRSGIRPARIHPIGPDDILRVDTDGLIEAITANVEPGSWDQVGGVGSIAMDLPRLALLVAQTPAVHDELSELLTMLRRSRYASRRSDRPWESTTALAASPLLGPLAAMDASIEPRLSSLPEPKPAELAALDVRRVPATGQWKWRRMVPDGDVQDTIVVRRWGRRMEIELPRWIVRTESDAAAIAYADLALVEHGNWAEAARRSVDTWLPWLPHRTNEELARWFDVRAVHGETNGGQPEVVRLRLVPPGFSPRSGTYLEVAFSKKDELPQTWEFHEGGKLAGRLRFTPAGNNRPDAPRRETVVLEDAAGRSLVRWELIDSKPKTNEIPGLTAGFAGYVHLDRRSDRPGIDPGFHRALVAMRKGDWPAAVRHLDDAEKAHPQHPLLLLLRAWCFQQDQRLGRRDQIVAALRQAAAGEAAALPRFIAEGNFSWFSARQRYEILSLAPPENRSAIDWDHLARAAIAAGKLMAALDHAKAALAITARDGREFERERIRVEILLRLDRAELAAKAADDWATAGAPTAEQLATMAELLAEHGSSAAADALFARALAPADLTPRQRYGLMCRRADVQDGLPRWRTLLQAATLVPADSPGRRRCMALLLGELSRPVHAEIASALAGRTKDPHLQGQLLIRQAELILDPVAAGDILWRVHQSGQLPGTRLGWACGIWNRARQPQRVINASEQRLRSGKQLPDQVNRELEHAYVAAGRTRDARRAATRDPGPTQQRSPRGGFPFSSAPGGGLW